MITLPHNTPAFQKYLPWYATLTPDEQQMLYEACVRHGMKKYGKTLDEAQDTEARCIELMRQVFATVGRENLGVRDQLFAVRTAYAESSKSIREWQKYVTGNVVEIGSGGMPCVENAIQCELSPETYAKYNAGQQQEFPAQWRSDSEALPFKDETMDCCFSSHLIEDFADWRPPLTEWTRLVKIGGYIVILVPDKESWLRALRNGQPPNAAHRHESYVGELTKFFNDHFPHFTTLEDRLLSHLKPDYTILFVAIRTA